MVLAAVRHDLLPAIMRGEHYTPVLRFIVTCVWLLDLAGLLVLWKRPPRSALDVWLLVVMVIRPFDIALSARLNAGWFDVGCDAGRIYGLAAGSIVLLSLLVETGALYARLARSFEI